VQTVLSLMADDVIFTVPGREPFGKDAFRAASETLLTIAADPKRLGAAIGFLAVLHTWGQNLHMNPHS
jgi:ketosteroid isomerase-like protein